MPQLVGCSRAADASGLDLSRYPPRVPEWLWQDPRYASLIPPALRVTLQQDLERLEPTPWFGQTSCALRKERRVACELAATFSLGDLSHGAPVVTHPHDGLGLAVQIDPAFDEQARRTLLEASERFVRHALDEAVIARSLAASARERGDRPPSSRSRPPDPAAVQAQLRPALSAQRGEPALLVISRYTGNAWWGGAKLNFFHDPTYHLSRVPPPRGYLYIRLNADKLRPAEPHGRDPAFWAGKIGHEVLHNLGYTHPRYKDPADRDAQNQGDHRAFVVAYEREVQERARRPGR